MPLLMNYVNIAVHYNPLPDPHRENISPIFGIAIPKHIDEKNWLKNNSRLHRGN